MEESKIGAEHLDVSEDGEVDTNRGKQNYAAWKEHGSKVGDEESAAEYKKAESTFSS